MPDLYTSLNISPRKKRCPPTSDDDEHVMPPKKLRIAPPTPPVSKLRPPASPSKHSLPAELSRLLNIQTALQHALSHALATCALSPTSDAGHVRNVLNHLSLTTYSGFSSSFDISDILKLCWIWEWDGEQITASASKLTDESDDGDNPFLDRPRSPTPLSDWTRGAMGFIVTPATHHSKTDRKRVPAYGIGIEVEIDIDKDMSSGMAAVARWTANAETRRNEFLRKLEKWVKLHEDAPSIPHIPLADLPKLAVPKISALTRTLASCSPSAIPASKLPQPPSSPSRSPTKRRNLDFAIPFPSTSIHSSPIKKSAILFPQTPSRHDSGRILPVTPSTKSLSYQDSPSSAEQPPDSAAPSPAQTPASRRQALYERVRQRSLSKSPSKSPSKRFDIEANDTSLTRDQVLKMSQEAMRKRCLLGRLPGVAESIWMLFSNPSSSNSLGTPSRRKRRALPLADIIHAVIKSSPVPISNAEANESLTMLTDLCPFFIRKLDISGHDWVEMPAASTNSTVEFSPSKPKFIVSDSPKVKGKEESAQELLTRSPKKVQRDAGGLREVREIIRRELELHD